MRTIFYTSILLCCFVVSNGQYEHWSWQKINDWSTKNGFLCGSNYLPATAINQLEMFQAETYDPKTIDKELTLAEEIGLNTMRVFLHDKLWQTDAKGFKVRLNDFLDICAKHKIKPMLVFFDSCWDPFPKAGPQHAPVAGLHNSGWVQSPGVDILQDKSQWPFLEKYVKDIIKTYKNDPRILAWDMWNEPDNTNASSYGRWEPENKVGLVNELLVKVFKWAREEKPSQPLTSGLWMLWKGSWEKNNLKTMSETEQIQIGNSDFISFHCYTPLETFEKKVAELKSFAYPLVCTEYLARSQNNSPSTLLEAAKRLNVGMVNWGFMEGKENTKYPWDSWDKAKYTKNPEPWHHLLFRADYSPYKTEEIESIKKVMGKL
jgi:hypothetical protein